MKTLVFFFMTLSVCVLAMPSTKSYNHDDYRNRNKVTNTNNETSPPEGRSRLHTSIIDTEYVTIISERNDLCVYYGQYKEGCVDANNACGAKFGDFSLGCADDEELFQKHCFKKCSLLANKHFPLRTAMNTCSRNGCTSSQEYDAGLCYPKCKKYYIGVAHLCWGYCSRFCGRNYSDMGLYCYRWWLPHACSKPSYDRGAGSAPYQPWTKGNGCSGFNVDNTGKCPTLDISDKLPTGFCNRQ